MRTVAHLSDLHFGAEDVRVVEGLLEDLAGFHPNVVVISGDLTQRARKKQFERAAAFIRRISVPCLVVPGNHDIPLFDVVRRTLRPLRWYLHYISTNLNPVFQDDELLILGADTARAAALKNGRISKVQIRTLAERFSMADSNLFKVLVTHHPFLPPVDEPYATAVRRGARALAALEPCGLDLLLAGHYHRGYQGDVRSHYLSVKRSILVSQAGTAISKRLRGEKNSYDRISVDAHRIGFERYAWDGHRFAKAMTTRYIRIEGAWQPES